MLSIFPQLFNYSYFAPFILRVALAFILLANGYSQMGESGKFQKAFGITKILGAVFFVAGFLTQPTAILVGVAVLAEILRLKIKKISIPTKGLKFLILAIAVSLILLGPGIFALDLPL